MHRPCFRSIHDWNVVKGRIDRQFSHPSRRGRFSSFAPNSKRTRLYALDMHQRLHIWNLEQGRGQSFSIDVDKRRHQKTTKKVEPQREMQEAAKAKQVPVEQVVDLREFGISDKQTIIECSVHGGLILYDEMGRFYHVLIGDANEDHFKVTEISLKHRGRKLLKLDDHKIVIVSLDRDSMKWVFYVYHVLKGIEYISEFDYVAWEDDLVLSHTGEILIPVADSPTSDVVIFDPMNGTHKRVSIPDLGDDAFVVTCESGACIAYCKTTLKYRGLDITEDSLVVSEWVRSLSPNTGDTLTHITLTYDGKYILCVTNNRMLRLIRYSDGKLLALYTMYDSIRALNISRNNHYALISTQDKRLFTLVIADPRERDHDARIAHVRDQNPGLSRERALALMGETNNMNGGANDLDFDSSDDEAPIRRAEQRLDKEQRMADDILFCLQSDEQSSEESDGESRISTQIDLGQNETGGVEVHEDGLKPTAHDGTIFSPTPCSLQ